MAPGNEGSSSEGDSSDDDDDLDDDMDGTNRWFYHPFQYHGNKCGDPEGENDAQPSQSSGQSSDGSDEDDITDGGPCLSGLFNLKLTAMP